MPTNKPLSYPSLTTVLTHLNADFRLELFNRCPQLKNLHKLTPMRIDKLRVEKMEFQINSTTFKLGILRFSAQGPTPDYILRENSRGGLKYDIDEYGFEKYGSLMLYRFDDRRMREMEQELVSVRNQKFHFDPNNPQNVYHKALLTQAQKKMESLELALAPYRLRMANGPAIFNRVVRITATSHFGIQKGLIPYGNSLQEVIGLLVQKVLPMGQTSVKKLWVNCDDNFEPIKLALANPKGLGQYVFGVKDQRSGEGPAWLSIT